MYAVGILPDINDMGFLDFLNFPQKHHGNNYVVEKSCISSTNISSIEVCSDNIDITIVKADGPSIRYTICIRQGFTTEDLDFELTTEGSLVKFSLHCKKNNMEGELKLEIPDTVKVLSIENLNGDVSSSIRQFDEFSINVSNGDISIKIPKNLYKITKNTINGDINCSIESKNDSNKTLSCQSINGDISIRE